MVVTQKMCSAQKYCILRAMKHKKFVSIALVGLLALAAGIVGLFVLNKDSEQPAVRASERKVIYVYTMQTDGGVCGFIARDKAANAQNECVDESDVEMVLETYGLKKNGVTVRDTTSKDLVKIDADMHIEVEKRTPSTTKPQYREVDIHHIDKVYSAELVKS